MGLKFKILLIEDSQDIQYLIIKSFPEKDFAITCTSSIEEARTFLNNNQFSAVILDINLPDGDGLGFYAEIKNTSNFAEVPIFILSAQKAIQFKAIAFHLGVEDYVEKPFNPLELKLRVESRLKKILALRNNNKVQIGNLELNIDTLKVLVHFNDKTEEPILSSTEFKILHYLIKNQSNILSREQIIYFVWGNTSEISDRTVDSHISRIRKKIKNSSCIIESISNVGYIIKSTSPLPIS